MEILLAVLSGVLLSFGSPGSKGFEIITATFGWIAVGLLMMAFLAGVCGMHGMEHFSMLTFSFCMSIALARDAEKLQVKEAAQIWFARHLWAFRRWCDRHASSAR